MRSGRRSANGYGAVRGLDAVSYTHLGSSLLIVVGFALETVKAVESQMVMRHYKGFLSK